MDDSSDDEFSNVVQHDESTVVFATSLSKRLIKAGERTAAYNIMSRLDDESKKKVLGFEGDLIAGVESYFESGDYYNWFEHPRDVF